MPLETGTLISDLAPTNPAHTDGLNNADAHLRLIKSTLKTTFPNITGAVSASHTNLNDLAAQLSSGVSILKDTGVHFATNTFDGLTNPSAGKVDIVGRNHAGSGSAVVAEFNGDDLSTALKGAVDVAGNAAVHGSATVTGTLAVTGAITGPGTVPVGGMIMWLDDTLPADGAWCWANGGTLSRTGNGAALWAKWGARYGAGDGTTTFNVIDMQNAVPVGKDTMGGAASPGLLASIASGIKGALNGLFGSDTHTLAIGELPPHTHNNTLTDPGHAHTFSPGNSNAGGSSYPGASTSTSFPFGVFNGPVSPNTTGITINNASVGSGTAFAVTQPSRVVNFIIRIA